MSVCVCERERDYVSSLSAGRVTSEPQGSMAVAGDSEKLIVEVNVARPPQREKKMEGRGRALETLALWSNAWSCSRHHVNPPSVRVWPHRRHASNVPMEPPASGVAHHRQHRVTAL